MVLDRYAPWQDFIFNVEDPELKAKADNIMYVIYPGNRGGYQQRVVPKEFGSFEQRYHVPKEWLGLKGIELINVCGIGGATFVHPNGFIGGNSDKELCIIMVKKAIAEGTKNC